MILSKKKGIKCGLESMRLQSTALVQATITQRHQEVRMRGGQSVYGAAGGHRAVSFGAELAPAQPGGPGFVPARSSCGCTLRTDRHRLLTGKAGEVLLMEMRT